MVAQMITVVAPHNQNQFFCLPGTNAVAEITTGPQIAKRRTIANVFLTHILNAYREREMEIVTVVAIGYLPGPNAVV